MTWTSDYEPVEVGGTTFHELIAATAARHGERVALVDGATGAGVTYATLLARSERVAATLAARGFGARRRARGPGAERPARGRASPSARWPPAAR